MLRKLPGTEESFRMHALALLGDGIAKNEESTFHV